MSLYRTLQTLLVIIVLLCLNNQAQAQQADQSVVVMFGDSIMFGFNPDFNPDPMNDTGNGNTDLGCPTIYLRNILNKEDDRQDPPCSVVVGQSSIRDANQLVANASVQNWGDGGSSSSQGVARMTSNLLSAQSAGIDGQRFALIMYGTNDFNFGLPPDVTEANTASMIDIARQNGFTPAVSNLTPRTPGINQQGEAQNLALYNNAILLAVIEKNADFVDMNARFNSDPNVFQTLISVDQLHPTDPGYLVLAETWFDQYLQGVISATPPIVSEPPPNISFIPSILLLLLDD